MNPSNSQCILFFTKWPEPGQVKTRLARDIGEYHAAQLYRFFLQDLSTQLRRMETRAICCYEPACKQASFQTWLGPDFEYVAQHGQDLGERLINAFQYTFDQGFAAAIVIGTDSPDLPLDHLLQAQRALEQKDAVIGPCQDGGYYLIGFQRERFLPEAFKEIDWSTERVFHQTKTRLDTHRRKLHVLPTWFDIDTHRDLGPLIERNHDTAFAHSQSYAFICQHGWQTVGEIEQ
jgi:rSAM/selenodomain-associated transferase 1